MTCVEFQTRLSGYLDGELSRWKRWKVENHVRSCGECAGLLRDLEEVDQCLAAGVRSCEERAPGRDWITGAVMRRLPVLPPVSHPRPAVRRLTAGLALAAAQIVAVAGAYWWGFNHGTGQQAISGSMGPGAALRTQPQQAPVTPASHGGPSRLWGASPSRLEGASPQQDLIQVHPAAGQKPADSKSRSDVKFKPSAPFKPVLQPTGSH